MACLSAHKPFFFFCGLNSFPPHLPATTYDSLNGVSDE